MDREDSAGTAASSGASGKPLLGMPMEVRTVGCTASAPACTSPLPRAAAAFPGTPIGDRTVGCRLPANDGAAAEEEECEVLLGMDEEAATTADEEAEEALG